MKNKLQNYLVIIGAFALLIVVISILSSVFGLTFNIVKWILSFGGISSITAILSGFLAFWFTIVYMTISKPKTMAQTLEVVGLAAVQWVFIAWIYYGQITDLFVSAYGYEPRLVALVQTPLLIVAVGIIYYGALVAYDVKPAAWKAYALFSIFGTVVIMAMVYTQPYSLFRHDTSKAKFYVLRDDTGKLIDVSYSPKFSIKYGKRLRIGTPADVPDVIEYKNKNDVQSFLYSGQKKLAENEKNDKKQETTDYRPIFEPVGEGRYIFTLEPMEKTAWKKIQPGMVWELHSVKKGDWLLIPFGGEIISYQKTKSKYVDFGEMPMIFAVFAKEKLTFVLDVYPRRGRM